MIHDFNQKLEFSLGERELFDIDLLKRIIPKCKDIQKTSVEVDKTGVDYIATLEGGATINIDAKTREKGASRYWHNGEAELAIELWSAVKTATNPGKVGWTYSTESNVDYILYTFDKSDCDRFYFLPFQLLRTAAVDNCRKWVKEYPVKYQQSNGWQSKAIFVPASVVISEINRQMTGIAYYQTSV